MIIAVIYETCRPCCLLLLSHKLKSKIKRTRCENQYGNTLVIISKYRLIKFRDHLEILNSEQNHNLSTEIGQVCKSQFTKKYFEFKTIRRKIGTKQKPSNTINPMKRPHSLTCIKCTITCQCKSKQVLLCIMMTNVKCSVSWQNKQFTNSLAHALEQQ